MSSSSFSPFVWVVFNPEGLFVRGTHSGKRLPVDACFAVEHPRVWEEVRQRVLSTPGGFDGERAVLLEWGLAGRDRRTGQQELVFNTGFRTYSEGTALKKMVAQTLAQASLSSDAVATPPSQPSEGWSWGSSLTTVVLLPGERVLLGQRAAHLQANPGRWACVFTEVLEPADVSPWGLEDLLERLTQEELPAFQELGEHRFVGLLFLPRSYTWTLVSVLDLRMHSREEIDAAMSHLAPDNETQAWGSLPLSELVAPVPSDVEGFELAQDVARRLRTGA